VNGARRPDHVDRTIRDLALRISTGAVLTYPVTIARFAGGVRNKKPDKLLVNQAALQIIK
jgi:hypothetical protein